MKMMKIEKLFVNSPSHSQQVSDHAKRLLQRIEFKAGQKYLDVGCGNGAAAVNLARKYRLDVTGIDVDPEQIQAAQKMAGDLSNARFLTLDGTGLPFEDAVFDLVFTNKVTHHIPDWGDAVREMIRVLRSGGFLIYSDLVFPEWIATVGKNIGRKVGGFPAAGKLAAIFEENSLETIHLAKSSMQYETIVQRQ